MARYGDEDRDTFLDDMGVVVRYGSKCVKGNLDEEEELESDDSGGNVLVIRTVLLVNTVEFEKGGKLYGLTVGGSITADGTPYTVHDKRLQSDGGFTTLVIARV